MMMYTMASPKRGDVVLVRFQYENPNVTNPTDLSKVRPCLILSTEWYHVGRQEVILAAITSNMSRTALPGDCEVTHWKEAGLLKPSVVTAILRTVKRSEVIKQMGQMRDSDLTSFVTALSKAIGVGNTPV